MYGRWLFVILCCFLMVNCVSVKKHNENIHVLRTEKELKKDVDYLHKKLQKLYPNLYWYIGKQELDDKFDSLKSTLTPMTSNEFYAKISPVLASIRQGHNVMNPLVERLSKEERRIYKKSIVPLNQFNYELFDDKLYIVKNNSADTSILAGTEVVAINGITPQEVYAKYVHSFTSDGYNETYYPKGFSRSFSNLFQIQYGKLLLDSAVYRLRYDDIVTEYRAIRTDKETMRSSKAAETDNRRPLTYLEADSSIALMTIPSFKTKDRSFYKKSFKQLRTANTQTLIIDLRNNPGGSVRDIRALYTYLSDTSFYFLRNAEVASRTSTLQPNIFKGSSIGTGIIRAILYPFKLIEMGVTAVRIKQEAGKYYSRYGSGLTRHNSLYFTGDVYVLINGGSFSASSIISSNLHGAKRATFVGEETGGAYNGCVAGLFYNFTLPKSKLKGRFGLITIQPFYLTDSDGRGIMPDMEVLPTLKERINGIDPELNTVLNLVRSKQTGE